MPEARPSRTLQANPTMTSERLSAESTRISRATWGRRRMRVRKKVNGNATAMHTAPANNEMPIENAARSRNTGSKSLFQLPRSNAGW